MAIIQQAIMVNNNGQIQMDLNFVRQNWVLLTGLVFFVVSYANLTATANQIADDLRELKDNSTVKIESLHSRVSVLEVNSAIMTKDVQACINNISQDR